jgi:hypothetical protein
MNSESLRSGIISITERRLWEELVSRTGARDVYFLPEYLGFYEHWEEVEARLFFYTEGENILLYPFLRRPLPELTNGSGRHCDVCTAYGYGGPLVIRVKADPAFGDRARRALEESFERMGVVSEFIRFHPLLDNHHVWRNVPTSFDRHTVAMDLSGATSELWRRMTSNTRRKIRQSYSEDLTTEIDRSETLYSEFSRLYQATMERVGAEQRYRFSEQYVLDLGETLGKNAVVCSVRHRGRPAAAGIFLQSDRFLHYHLGGSDAELLHVRPNDRMFYEMACWGRENRAERFHLGGGTREGDSLFRFKAGYSKDVRGFYVGRVVHDEYMYAVLTEARMRKSETPPAAGFFPAYRG